MAKAVRNSKGKTRPAKGADKGGRASEGKGAAKSAGKSAGKSSGKGAKPARGRSQARTPAKSTTRNGREKRSLRKFMREVRVELGKVSWPNRRELLQSTLVVLVAVLIATAYVAGLDAAFNEVVDQILNLIT